MFDIGWSELVVIGIVALIAIGPKELPGVLRMVGQWMGKARRMAAEFQGQFQEAMREAEMADVKKQFDDINQSASNLASGFDPLAPGTPAQALPPQGPVLAPDAAEPPPPESLTADTADPPPAEPVAPPSEVKVDAPEPPAPPAEDVVEPPKFGAGGAR